MVARVTINLLFSLAVLFAGCTFLADTDLPSAEMELGSAMVNAYDICNAGTLICPDQTECVVMIDDGIELASFCAPVCEADDDCPTRDDTPGRCLLGSVGNDSADRCVLACNQDHIGTPYGCPRSMICSEVQGTYLCL